ncbi:Gfo/Idh/MocA family protein [Pseudactinotalea sp. Z1739]|uniref:Gfo/Idh/MocA family protein n=1 Tax=Pseudactinotalea sp. Z1739 TaxID=3413028 RepID=UPI003C7E011E
MAVKIAIVGAGQFAGSFATLWQLHPEVSEVYVTDVVAERAAEYLSKYDLAGTFADFDEVLASDVDAVAIFTQRWTHGQMALAALQAGKHVYSSVPMAIESSEIEAIVAEVAGGNRIYMMGETSYYNPAVWWAREKIGAGEMGRVFYSEGDYVHDMDNGFYAAYQFSGGENWKRTASFPPMLYPTHAVGGVLGALPTYATSVSCIGVVDDRDDGVFDKSVSMFDNDFSNMSAHFELADGGVMRTNEFRRVGHPAHVHESRFRFYGTDAVMEQTSNGASLSDRNMIEDISPMFRTHQGQVPEGELEGIDEALRHSFSSGTAPVQDRSRLPKEFEGAPNGHEGSHHFLADDFVKAVRSGTHPPVNAWTAARFTLPGIAAWESARNGGVRVPVLDLGDAPA